MAGHDDAIEDTSRSACLDTAGAVIAIFAAADRLDDLVEAYLTFNFIAHAGPAGDTILVDDGKVKLEVVDVVPAGGVRPVHALGLVKTVGVQPRALCLFGLDPSVIIDRHGIFPFTRFQAG